MTTRPNSIQILDTIVSIVHKMYVADGLMRDRIRAVRAELDELERRLDERQAATPALTVAD